MPNKLIRPNKELLPEIEAFRREFLDLGEKINGSCGLHKSEYDDLNLWLKDLELSVSGKLSINGSFRTPSAVFLAVSDKTIVGIADIRFADIKFFCDPNDKNYVNGHIGSSVRPSERRKGHAANILTQALNLSVNVYKNSINLVTCNKENEPSRKTIEKCGGVFENEFLEDNGNYILRYWF